MLEALAAVILVGLMLIPAFNIAIGFIAGLVLAGPVGGLLGAFIGFVISAMWSRTILGY